MLSAFHPRAPRNAFRRRGARPRTKIVRPSASTAAIQPKLQPALLSLSATSSQYLIPVLLIRLNELRRLFAHFNPGSSSGFARPALSRFAARASIPFCFSAAVILTLGTVHLSCEKVASFDRSQWILAVTASQFRARDNALVVSAPCNEDLAVF